VTVCFTTDINVAPHWLTLQRNREHWIPQWVQQVGDKLLVVAAAEPVAFRAAGGMMRSGIKAARDQTNPRAFELGAFFHTTLGP
jgi:hypothetical protein